MDRRIVEFLSESEIDELLERIRAGKVPNNDFTHREHVAMAATIVFERPEGSLNEIRKTILNLNMANGVEQTPTGGYHETLTVAWHVLVSAQVAALPAGSARVDAINAVVGSLMDKTVILRHYSKDLIMSWKARTTFVEPDITPLPVIEV